MSYSTFNIICNELCPYIRRNDTNLRFAISVEERVAISIWKLSTNLEYRTLSELFGIGRSTVCEIIHDTCQHIVINLLPKYVKIPKGDRLKELVESFELTKGFPQAVGAIDGTHIPKAVANGPVGQVLAGPLFLKVKTKFHFTKSK